MRFKQYLSESAVSKVPTQIPEFSLSDILACYKNTGYGVSESEVRSFISSKYIGFNKKQHTFAVLWLDENGADDEQFCINEFYIQVNHSGLIAEPSSMPIESYATKAEGAAALKKL